MLKQISLVFATLAMSTVAFAQFQDGVYQIGYAANLNIGDAQINISNDGVNGGFYNNNTTGLGAGNICANVYVFDPSEEEVSCCSCLVTPNALVSLSAKNSLIADVLTPAIPTSIVIKLIGSTPGATTGGALTACNPATVGTANVPLFAGSISSIGVTNGLLAWGATLEPAATPGTYGAVPVPFINGTLSGTAPFVVCAPVPPFPCIVLGGDTGSLAQPPDPGSELAALTSVCSFVQQEGTGFGVCKSCALGALSGTKQ